MVPAVFLQTANEVGIFDCADDTNKVKFRGLIYVESVLFFDGKTDGYLLFEIQVEAGTHVEMPFWLAQELYVRQVVSIKVPPYFDTK